MIKKKSVRLMILNLMMIGVVVGGCIFFSFHNFVRYFPLSLGLFLIIISGFIARDEFRALCSQTSRYNTIIPILLVIHFILEWGGYKMYSPFWLVILFIVIPILYRRKTSLWKNLFFYVSLIWGVLLLGARPFLL